MPDDSATPRPPLAQGASPSDHRDTRAIRYRQELRSLQRADAIINATACLLFVAWMSWSYLLGRTLEIGPSITALGLGALTGAVLGLPSTVILLISALIRGHRSPRRIAIFIATTLSITIVASEAYISTQDVLLRTSDVEDGTWRARWFPFGNREILYRDATGWMVVD